MVIGVKRVHGVSRATGLPRFVIRVRAGGRTYHYFRHGPIRERLPNPASAQFAGSYAAALARHGLCAVARGAGPPQMRTRAEVYFIQDLHSGAIKIGAAQYPAQRLRDLQVGTSASLKLLGNAPGGRRLERELHERLRDFRIRGEWFLNAKEVRAAMREICG